MNVIDSDLDKLRLSTSINKSCTLSWKERSLGLLENSFSENKLSNCKESSSVLLKKKANIEKKLSSQMSEIKRIRKELDELESENSKDPNKYAMKLYELISNITWDLDSLPNEVKGYISKPFTVFDFNTEKQSEYFIVSHLWKLIGDEEKATANKS